MDSILLIKQGLLFAHAVAFAVALGEILRGDWRILRAAAIDMSELDQTARVVGLALAGLWLTGAGLIYIDTGFVPALLAEKPKLMAKLIVVVALTANGALLHALAFPLLRGAGGIRRGDALVCSVLGAISTVSWLYAAFVGVARLIAAKMALADFLALYGAGLALGVGVGVTLVAPAMRRRLGQPLAAGRADSAVRDEAAWTAVLDAERQASAAALDELKTVAASFNTARPRPDRQVA